MAFNQKKEKKYSKLVLLNKYALHQSAFRAFVYLYNNENLRDCVLPLPCVMASKVVASY